MIREQNKKFKTIILVGKAEQGIWALVPMLPQDYNVLSFTGGDEASATLSRLDAKNREGVGLVICEQNLQDMDGTDFMVRSQALLPQARRILLIDYPQLDMEALHRAQLFRFITRPYVLESLLSTIRLAMKEIEMEQQPIHCDQEIIGQDPAFMEVLETVKRLSYSQAPVLIRGETGTGKELIARALYCNGPGKGKPYVVVNCSALPENLFEVEMFGHKKGAFTGAYRDRKGWVSQAEGGTLFIDEVGDVPLPVQAKLLRFLQFGEFHRVGSDRIENANVRLVAATNRDLEKMVEEGTFRRDLYYRLNVLEIKLPPLRERPNDIRPLARAFIRKYWHRPGKPILTEYALRELETYDYPGNVRELENAIQRACLLAKTEEIDLDILPPQFIKTVTEKKPMKPALLPTDDSMFTRFDKGELKKARIKACIRAGFQVEEVFLRQLMDRFGTVTGAAAHAGMQRTYLHNLLTKHGLR